MPDLSTEVIEQSLKDALERLQRCWVGQSGATLPAYKLLSVGAYLRKQLDALYTEAFADPEKTDAQ